MDTNGHGLAKFLPKAVTSRRWRKHSGDTIDFEPHYDSPLLPTSLSNTRRASSDHTASDEVIQAIAAAQPELDNSASQISTDQDSKSGVAMTQQERTPSVISTDSDLDIHSSGISRPSSLSPHPSQIGCLTTSSPLVQDTHFQGTQTGSISRSPTVNVPDIAQSFDVSPQRLKSSNTGLLPPQASKRRSPSPVGRFREVFRSKKTSSASSSPERCSIQAENHHDTKIPTNTSSNEVSTAASTDPPSLAGPSNFPTINRPRSLSKPKQPMLDTAVDPPRTPEASDQPAPVIVNTPPTPTNTVLSRPDQSPTRSAFSPTSEHTPQPSTRSHATSSPNSVSTAIRRTRAGSSASTTIVPSKLSNVTLPPLTPTPESGPNGTPGPSPSGFFSSMLSAAQNAANTLSSSISTPNLTAAKQKATTATEKEVLRELRSEKSDMTSATETSMSDQALDQKELAIKTLGQGDLSLSQLGLAESNSRATTPVTSKFPDAISSRHRSDSAPADAPFHEFPSDDAPNLPRPISLYDNSGTGDRTPPTASVYEGKTSGVQRSGSIRSAIGGSKRRTRVGSSATGTTIGAAVAATTSSLADLAANVSTPKLTGFAVASKKRNRDFHNLFKSVPDDDYLIEDYSCAIQREILAHGRLYVSEGHLCFSSNIFGWITTLVMSFDEIVSVEKRSTALVFKNGLMISTLHAKHIFASFTSRDSTYDLIINIWKLGHPSLRSTLNGVQLEETGGDKTEKVDVEPPAEENQSASESGEESEECDEMYDEDEEDGYSLDITQVPETSSVNGDADKATATARKVSGPALSTTGGDKSKEGISTAVNDNDFPGPATHAPTDCGDAETHYDKVMGDDIIPAPLGKIFNMMFGPPSWMSKFITNDQKCTELQMDEKIGLSSDVKSREYTYIKPLNAPIGPKQTKCVVTETLDSLDFNKAANVSVSTQTPDVPSGNAFSVNTRYCLSWAENNCTRIQMTCSIEWTGKSWIKGAIEKGSFDGQTQYAKELFAALKTSVASRSRSGTLTNGTPVKVKKKGKKLKQVPATAAISVATTKASTKSSWGVFEPVEPFLTPILDIIKPFATSNIVFGVLLGVLVATWCGIGWPSRQAVEISRPYGGPSIDYRYYPDRVAAYEEIWRREESDLWEWLEERVSLDRLGNPAGGKNMPKQVIEPRTIEERLRKERMNEREIEEAIRVTEEKLKMLKEVVEKRKGRA